MVSKKVYFAGLFALVLLVSVFVLGFAAARDYGIMGPGISVYITDPANGTAYTHHVSNFSWSINPWTSLASCWYTLNGGAENFVNCYDNFSNFASPLADGTYDLHFVANKTITQIWDDEITFLIDTTPPLYSSEYVTPPNPATYSPGIYYEFGIKWDGTESSVWYEFNGVNYSGTYNSGGIYHFNRTDLGAGTYNYRWYANDSLGNTNQTDLISYVVSKADPTSGMSITGTTPIVYETTSDFSYFETNVGDGDCIYDLLPLNWVFGGGTTTFTFSTGGCANYTAGSVTKVLTVNPAPTTTTVVPSVASPIVYGDSASFSCSNSKSLATELYIDGVNRTSEKGVALILGAKTSYNVTCFGIANQNYSGSSDAISFVVNRAPQNAVLGLSPSSSIIYRTDVNATCNGFLFRNDVDVSAVENGLNVLLGVGSYNYSCKLFENENYTFAEMNATLVVNKADPTLVGSPVLSIVVSPAGSVYTGTETNVSGVGCPSELNCTLYRDNIEVNNSDVGTLAAGSYAYVYNTTGNENYSSAAATAGLTVSDPPSTGGGGGHHVSSGCSSDWVCTDWGPCLGDIQTRICTLAYEGCVAVGEKPFEAQVCDSAWGLNNTMPNGTETETKPTKIMDESASGNPGITGAAIGALSGGTWFVIILFIAGIAGAYGYVVWRKKSFRSSLERTLWQAAQSNIKK